MIFLWVVFNQGFPKTPMQSRCAQRVVISVTGSIKYLYLVPGFVQHSFFQRKIRQDQEKNMR